MKLDVNNTKCLFCDSLLVANIALYCECLTCPNFMNHPTNNFVINYFTKNENSKFRNTYEFFCKTNGCNIVLYYSSCDLYIFYNQYIWYDNNKIIRMNNIIMHNDLFGPLCAFKNKIYKFMLYNNLGHYFEET